MYLNYTATSANPGFKSPQKMLFGSPPTSNPFPFLSGIRSVNRRSKWQPKTVRYWYLGPALNYPRNAIRFLCKSSRVMVTRHVTWAHVSTLIPPTLQQAILVPRERDNSSASDESGEGQAPSPAVKSRPTSSEDDESGGEGHSGGDDTADVFVYDGVGVGGGLDDLDGTPREAEEHRQRYQSQLRSFNMKCANQQGSLVETASRGGSDAPSEGAEGDSPLPSSSGGVFSLYD